MSKGLRAAVIAFTIFAQAATVFAWEPPKDETLTEKQVTGYLAAFKEWMEVSKAAGKQMEGANSLTAMKAALSADAGFKEAIRKQGLAEEEFAWIGGKLWETWAGQMMADMYVNGKKEIEQSLAKSDEKMAQARAKMTRYEAALKAGKRVLTDEQKKQIATDAAEEAKAAEEEAKDLEKQAAEYAKEAVEAEKEAMQADKLAAKPPADIAIEDRADYVAEKKEEATNARERVKESQANEAESRKAAAEARARGAFALAKTKDPEAVSADEAANVKQYNTDSLEAAKAELEHLQQMKLSTAQGLASLETMKTETLAKLNPQNLALVQKHKAAIEAMMGGNK